MNIDAHAPTLDDVPRIVELLNECAGADGVGHTDASEVRMWLTNPTADVGENFRLFESNGALVAYADVNVRGEGTRVRLDPRVRPDRRDAETIASVLEWAEARAKAIVRAGPAGAESLLRVAAPSSDDALVSILRERGYGYVRSTFEMGIELDEAVPEPHWPQGIEARTARPGEERAVYEAHQEAFADNWEHTRVPFEEWIHFWTSGNGNEPPLWFLAVDDDEIAAFSLCERYPRGDVEVGWVGALGVRRPWRRRGIGLALLLHSFREFHNRGLREARLAVDAESPTGATRLYERAAMHVTHRWDMYDRAIRR